MDVDGTLTDGKIYMGPSGEVLKSFNIKDGCGIHDILLPNNVTPVIITGRTSKIVLNRCQELGIKEVHQGISNKVEKLKCLITDLKFVAYIGDDINDLSCMKAVKAAGGIRDWKMAKAMIDLGVKRIGTSSSLKILEEFKQVQQ